MSKQVKKLVSGTDTSSNMALPIASPEPPVVAPKPSLNGTSTTWTATTGGNFNTAANWSNGVPVAGIDATIDEASTDPITVTISGVSDTVDALNTQFAGLSITNGTLILQGAIGTNDGSNIATGSGTALAQNGGLVDFQNGPSQNDVSSITSGGGGVLQTAGIIEVDAGTLNISGNSSFAGTLTGSGDKPDSGIITLGGGATYTFASTASISVGELSLVSGATMILNESTTYAGNFVQASGTTLSLAAHEFVLKDTAGTTSSEDGLITGGELANLSTLSMLNATLASGSTFNNAGVLLLNQGGGTAITLGNGGTGTALFENTNGGTLTVQNGTDSINGGTFTNSYRIVLATAGDLTTSSAFTNTGTITVGAGDVFNNDGNLTNSGTITGAGEFQIDSGGTDTLAAGSVVNVGTLAMSVYNDNVTLNINSGSITSSEIALSQGGLVNLNTNLSYAGTFAASSNAALLSINLGTNTLSLSGPTSFAAGNFGSISVIGAGTLALGGATTITLDGLQLGEGTTLSETGALTQSANVYIGDNIVPGAVAIGSAGVWNILGNFTLGGTNGSAGNTNSTVKNAGTLETTAVGDTATVNAVSTNTGTLSAVNGASLVFVNNLANTGTISGAGEFGVTAGTTTLGTGTVLSVGTLGIGNSGEVALATLLSYGGTFADSATGATSVAVGSGDTLTLSGPVSIGAGNNQGTTIDGSGALDLTSANTTVSNASTLVLGGGVAVTNTGHVTQDGFVQIGDNSGTSASVSNSAAGTWTLATGDGINRGTDFATTFTNAGIFQNTALNSVATIYAVFNNAGTVSATSSDIDFDSTFSNTGTISGTGTVGINGSGVGTLGVGSVLTVAQFNLSSQATLVLGNSLNYAGIFNDQGDYGTTFNLAGHNVNLTGKTYFGGDYDPALVTGTGQLSVESTTTITNQSQGLLIGGGATFRNTGVLTQSGQVQIGDASGTLSAVINGGTWNLATNAGISTGSNAASSFANSGHLENTGSNATQSISAVFNNTGTIGIAAGDETDFYNTLANTGTISGAGTIGLRASSITTFSSGETISIAQINIDDQATLNLATNLTYAGKFNYQADYQSYLNLGSNTLSLTASATFGGTYDAAYVDGSGTLALAGTTTITGSSQGLEIGGGLSLINSGKVTQDGQVQIGDSNDSTITTITNSATGTWASGAGNGIVAGANASSSFTNAGLFENTGTGFTQNISTSFDNTGTLTIGAGDQTTFANALANTGLINGAGTLVASSGEITFSAGSTISVAQIDITNESTLNIGTNLTYAGTFSDEGPYTDTLNLGSTTFSLTGAADFGGVNDPAYVDGTGTLALAGATAITGSNDGLETGASLAVVNSGSVVQSGNVQIGDTSGDQASITNSATGTWSFATGNGITTGINAASSFTNAGLVKNIGAGNTIRIGAVFNNTGTLSDPNAGSTVALADGGSIAGSLTGAGEIDFDGGVFTLGTSTVLGVASLGIYNSSTNVSLSAAASYAGSLTLGTGAILTLGAAAAKLTLTGQDSLDGLVTGSGTVLLSTGGTLIADNLTLGNAVTLEDSGGTIAQGANLTIGNSSASTANLEILAGSKYEITNNVTIGTDGLGAIANAGTFAMLAGTGTSTIDPLFTNTGTVTAGSGTLDFAANFTNNKLVTASNGNEVVFGGSVASSGSATGTIDLTGGGLAAFGGYVGSTESLVFTDGSSSKATLESPSNFDGTISGFSGTNELLLSDFENVTKSTFSGGVLSLTGENDGGTLTTVNLHFAGSYTLASFTLANNNQGGLIITDPPHG